MESLIYESKRVEGSISDHGNESTNVQYRTESRETGIVEKYEELTHACMKQGR